jgi:hypothetical protein
MLVDSSVARSFAVLGWTRQLVMATGGKVLLADGVHGAHPDDPSELRRIRSALQRQAEQAGLGSGLGGRALAAVQGLDELFALESDELAVMTLEADELRLSVRLQSRLAEDREWRRSMGAKSRRLDAGESASIAIASSRSLAFASDDEDALILWAALNGSAGLRTRDLLWRIVQDGSVGEGEAKSAHLILQTDDLHNLGGPGW